jgi:hypothetical protein
MSGKSSRITRAQARELEQIRERTAREGGTPHDEVIRRMRERMSRELRKLVRSYRHPSPEINEILELLALSRAEGLDVTAPLDELLEKIVLKARAA